MKERMGKKNNKNKITQIRVAAVDGVLLKVVLSPLLLSVGISLT